MTTLKIKNKITNPMTVIAIFAVISETSAAVSLPFLDHHDRAIYVWFLISFPFYLLFLFFITLNFNHRSLYSPSDFCNDKNFLKAIDNNERDNKGSTTGLPTARHCTFKVTSRIVTAKTDNTQCKEAYETHNSLDPPTNLAPGSSPVLHHDIRLPAAVSHLHIIDAREVDVSREVDILLDKIRHTDKKTAHAIVFLSRQASDVSRMRQAMRHIKHTKKGSPLCIIYNLRSQTLTLLGRE